MPPKTRTPRAHPGGTQSRTCVKSSSKDLSQKAKIGGDLSRSTIAEKDCPLPPAGTPGLGRQAPWIFVGVVITKTVRQSSLVGWPVCGSALRSGQKIGHRHRGEGLVTADSARGDLGRPIWPAIWHEPRKPVGLPFLRKLIRAIRARG